MDGKLEPNLINHKEPKYNLIRL